MCVCEREREEVGEMRYMIRLGFSATTEEGRMSVKFPAIR